MFLIRAAFWLSVVILLIPADPKAGEEAPRVTVIEALVATRATIADLSGFCERNPDVCVTGGAAAQLFSEKAQNGVRMLYRLFDKGEDSVPADGSDTLTKEDMLPTWLGPTKDGSA